MIAFNFPASPANGASYTPVGGPTFTWDGTAWKALSQGMPVTVFVGDVAPTAPSFGNLWWESDTGNLYIYYNDGDSAQWVQVNGTPAGYQTADTRNRIVNGAMQISQENGHSVGGSANTYYAADQWRSAVAGTGFTPDFRVNKTAADLLSPAYAYLAGGSTAKPALAATDWLGFHQPVEGINIADFGWGAAGAKPIVISFTGYATPAATYALTISSGAGDRSYVIPVTMTTTPTRYSFAIPGCTDGTWSTDNSAGLLIRFMGAVGSTQQTASPNQWVNGNFFGFTGMSNLLSAASQAMRFAQVGLYLDPDNTGVAPKWQMPDEAEELRACQRYWESSGAPTAFTGASMATILKAPSTTNSGWGTLKYVTTKRIDPSISIFPNDGAPSGSVMADGVKHPAQLSAGTPVGALIRLSTTGLVVGTSYYVYYNYIANARM